MKTVLNGAALLVGNEFWYYPEPVLTLRCSPLTKSVKQPFSNLWGKKKIYDCLHESVSNSSSAINFVQPSGCIRIYTKSLSGKIKEMFIIFVKCICFSHGCG